MNLRFLGDALDHWKGSLLERLQHVGLLRRLAVDPMAWDGQDWTAADWEILGKLLRLMPQQVLRHTASLRTQRPDYIREIKHSSDLFLDPDTGIATGRVSKQWQYIRPDELKVLLAVDPLRVIAVYQHIRAQKTRERLDSILRSLRDQVGPFCCCSYESSTVAMLFLSRKAERIKAIIDYHAALLGRHAPVRTNIWRCI